MKTLLKFTGLFLLFFVGCTSNQEIEELNAPALTKLQNQVAMQAQQPKTVTVPWKCEFASDPDRSLAPVQCIPIQANMFIGGGGWVRGNATHLGIVNQAESHFVNTGCNLNPLLMQLTGWVEGKITGANGDYFYYSGFAVTQLPEGTFEGDIVMNDGTGKFKGCTGNVHMIGSVDFTTGIMTWRGEGTVTFVFGKE